MFQVKSKFQLDGTKAIGSMIQPVSMGVAIELLQGELGLQLKLSK
jgi:hypothetical protein